MIAPKFKMTCLNDGNGHSRDTQFPPATFDETTGFGSANSDKVQFNIAMRGGQGIIYVNNGAPAIVNITFIEGGDNYSFVDARSVYTGDGSYTEGRDEPHLIEQAVRITKTVTRDLVQFTVEKTQGYSGNVTPYFSVDFKKTPV